MPDEQREHAQARLDAVEVRRAVDADEDFAFAAEIAYFEGRFRGGGSIGIVGSQQVFEVAGGRAHVGWHAPSFGYHSDDGALYFNDNARYDYQQQSYAGEGRGFGGASGAGDVVGCAVDLE